MNGDSQLHAFYLGAVTESERIAVERKLLSDPEHLLDFLDLKRQLDGADSVPSTPSPRLWLRLARRLPASKRDRISLAVGLMFACLLGLTLTLWSKHQSTSYPAPSQTHTLFDSGHEQLGLSNVL